MTRSRHRLAIVSLGVLWTCGCGQQAVPIQQVAQAPPAQPLTGPPEITSASEEEGMADLVFFIQEHQALADGSQSLQVAGVHKGRAVAFEVLLGPSWTSKSYGKDIPLTTHSGKVALRSTGAESDAFLQVLDEIYQTKIDPKEMGKETKLVGISLGGNPSDLKQGVAPIKVFFETDNSAEDAYGELFLNVDLPAHRLELSEKDDGYRLPIVKALQAH